ncbi:histidinol-phosphatase [Flavobacterium sp. ANB]|uniref:PHP domain-containing protein n=1 Tax=unclassified Flavobacterium TaxID=196869 RepID=UPI0012B94FA2|nr:MULTISPECIES: PHP domain-containing protein [unclassified Flavobacterium]MBF4518667.1 histidinol-phosphatase [Flavobacterium sp. ANB]MTD67827.1 histidinol-phosphatase [Flavobacterium sp. LC2016-13]
MKKIDLHIHTVPSISDTTFFFSLNSLKDYVEKLEIDCIAITNHNLFDKPQFEQISQELSIKVFPGIEIDLESGHILLISENDELEDFNSKCKKVTELIKTKNDWITYEQLIAIFPLLDKYLLIPHYDKKPNIKEETLKKLGDNIFAGEVTSLRKFKACIKESDKLVPVIFSDYRFTENMIVFPTRQTYVDAEESTLRAIKGCLFDKSKVFLSKEEGNDSFQATDDGVMLSTGLNVIIGERSSGKTYTLNKISHSYDNIKYLKQFSLLQNDEEKFRELVTTRHSLVSENYLKEFKDVVYDVNEIDIKANNNKIEKYIDSLKKYASENDKLDSFSKCKLYNETSFETDDLENLKKLIKATELLLENKEYKSIINKHITDQLLKSLILELIETHNETYRGNLKKNWTNDLIDRVKNDLRIRSSTTAIEDTDFAKIQMDKIKTIKFIELVRKLQHEKEIDSKEIRGFKVVARTKKYTGASQLKAKSKRQLAFTEAFNKYNDPYKFLVVLKTIGLEETEYYKYFADIEYKTLNKYGFEVSGGERSEFNLLHEISDALKHDILLIDEPESSFDNIFLKNEVNELIKEISREIPVIVVTHNSTIGASIKPDYLLYTQKIIKDENVDYKIYYGHPTSKTLKNVNGEEIQNLDILFNCLEAGQEAYYERKNRTYEILKD